MKSELSRGDVEQMRLAQRIGRGEIIEIDASSPGGPDKQPALKEYLGIVLSRRWLALGILVICVGYSAILLATRTPMFRATRRVLIQPVTTRSMPDVPVYDEPGLGGSSGESFLNTQYELLVSRPVLEATFNDLELNLGALEQFRDARAPLEIFAKHFEVSPVELTRLVDVSFTWSEPKLAARVVNKLVDYYIEDYRHRRLGVTKESLALLEDHAQELRPKVERSMVAKHEFMIKHNLASLEKDQSIVNQTLEDINRSLNKLSSERIQWESRMESISEALEQEGSGQYLPEVVNSETMRQLKLSLVKTQQQHSDLLSRLGPRHAGVITAASKITTIKEKMKDEARAILAAAQAQYKRIIRQEKEHQQRLAAEKIKVIEYSRLKFEYDQLVATSRALDDEAERIEKRVKEIELSLATGSKEDNIFPLGEASEPINPYSPRKAEFLLMGGLIGLILGVGSCFVLDYLDTTVKTREDVERLLGLPVLGYVPSLSSQSRRGQSVGQTNKGVDLLALDEPHSILAESFRSIRTSLSLSGNGQQGTTLLAVTSASPQEGKSIVSINLGLALARAGKKVLLIDADMRRPRLHKVFEMNPHPGLSNLLAGHRDVPLGLAIRPTEVANLSLLPSGPIPPNPAELLDSTMFSQLLGSLPADLDYVIFDTPPAANVTDAVILSSKVHRTILVVRSFRSQKNLLRRTAEVLQYAHGSAKAVILNNVDVPKGTYHYYDSYYYQQYSYYYGEEKTGRLRKKKRVRRKADRSGEGQEMQVLVGSEQSESKT